MGNLPLAIGNNRVWPFANSLLLIDIISSREQEYQKQIQYHPDQVKPQDEIARQKAVWKCVFESSCVILIGNFTTRIIY